MNDTPPNNTASEPDSFSSDDLATRRASRTKRLSLYEKSQQRRLAQARSDQRFYAGMFSLIGFTALLAILIGAISINGVTFNASGLAGWTTPWLGPFSKLELAGLGLITLIALAVYLRMRKRG
jgi:hypothetical protein